MTTVRHFGIDRTTACGCPAHRYSNHYETNEFGDGHQLFDYPGNGFERVDQGHSGTNTVRNAVLALLNGLNIEAYIYRERRKQTLRIVGKALIVCSLVII